MGHVPDMRCGPPLPPRLGHPSLPDGSGAAGGLVWVFSGGGGGGDGDGDGDGDGGEGALAALLSFEPNSELWLRNAAPPAKVAATTRSSVESSRARTAARD